MRCDPGLDPVRASAPEDSNKTMTNYENCPCSQEIHTEVRKGNGPNDTYLQMFQNESCMCVCRELDREHRRGQHSASMTLGKGHAQTTIPASSLSLE